MKKSLLIAITMVSSLFAYCETGTKIAEDYNWQSQKKIVTYDFGQGRILQFKFLHNQSVPYSIRYDFYKDEQCLSNLGGL